MNIFLKLCFTLFLIFFLSCSNKEDNIKNEKVDTLKVICDTIAKKDSINLKKIENESSDLLEYVNLETIIKSTWEHDYYRYDSEHIKNLKEFILLEEIDTLKKCFKNIPDSINKKEVIEKYYKTFDKDEKIPLDRNYSKKIRNFLRNYFHKKYNIELDTQNIDKQLNDSLIKNN